MHERTMGCSQSSLLQAALVQSIQEALGNDTELYAFPGDPLYKLKDVKVYNLSIPVKPSAVAYPKTSAQVAAIIKCAVAAGLKVQPRCGGHSYANYCTFPYSQITSQRRLQ
jgi:FAD/FMN-containing dehydrogenase